MKNSVIQIPVPCHENWDAMSQQEKGKFCSVCSKTVMDFSKHSKSEIVTYLSASKDEKVCGRIPVRMLDDQVSRSLSDGQRTQLSRFAFALFLVFGNFLFGYGQQHEKGEVRIVPVEETQTPDTLSLKDSLQNGASLPMTDTSTFIVEEPMMLGLMVLPVESPITEPVEEMKKGEIKVRKPEE